MRSRGSAIIIAFFLMAAISGVTFAIARLFYLDTSAADIYENSSIAYYAAESGVEEGLLRYRFDRQSVVGATNKVNRTNLNDLTVSLVDPNASLSTIADANQKSIFDLKMDYKTRFYGNEKVADPQNALDGNDLTSANVSDYGEEYLVLRDESVKIDITDTIGDSSDAKFMVVMHNYYTDQGFNKNKSFIEARVVGTVGSSDQEYKKILVSNNFLNFDHLSMVQMERGSGQGLDYYYKEQLFNKITGSVSFNILDKKRVFLYLRPIGCDILIGLAPSPGNSISAPYTTVKSTGYYGGISRTLEAKIDRQSGTVYDLFDFVTYQHPL